ncbi:MAG: formylglycine-generating enzyme family protein [Magnetococcales bacterium]|nr:formylglycine-generating enzyme family protein [Magnetococcales bacterium]MBF0437574.1 formylglycine-generating enzyme family protein [Magnetococcales bacterium]
MNFLSLGLLLGIVGFSQSASAFLINEWEPLTLQGAPSTPPLTIKSGTPWRDPVSDVPLLWVAGGCFQMGSPPRAEGRDTDEGPVHQKCVADFWLGESEITQGQWRRVMHNNPASDRKGETFPVENVSREDVNEFITALNNQTRTNVQFRLPTEAEWEYACRNGGQRTVYPGGSEPSRIAWYRGNSSGATHAVGTRAPNKLGLLDMSGNVWEWVQDPYLSSYAKQATSPGSQEDRTQFFAIRGGSWQDDASGVRCANRGFQTSTTRRADLGLRLAASLKSKNTKKTGKNRQIDFKKMPF